MNIDQYVANYKTFAAALKQYGDDGDDGVTMMTYDDELLGIQLLGRRSLGHQQEAL